MSEANIVQIIALLGWLVLMGSAFASYKLTWGRTLTYALIWLAAFAGVFAVFTVLMESSL